MLPLIENLGTLKDVLMSFDSSARTFEA